MNKFNVGKYLTSCCSFRQLFPEVIFCLIIVFAMATPVHADMSVNGFFSSDYVKTGFFDAKNSSGKNASVEVVAASKRQVTERQQQRRKASRVRSYPGRFSKTDEGTNRHQVENSEWDVGDYVPQ